MRLKLRSLNSLDVILDLLSNHLLMAVVEREIEGNPGIGPLHAVDVGVHDLAGHIERKSQFGSEWDLDPEDSMAGKWLGGVGVDAQPDTTTTQVHECRRELGSDRRLGDVLVEDFPTNRLAVLAFIPVQRNRMFGGNDGLWIQKRPGLDFREVHVPGVETRGPSLTTPNILGQCQTKGTVGATLLRGCAIQTEVARSEHPAILSDGDGGHEFNTRFDLDLSTKGHWSLDHHFLSGELQDLDSPHQIDPAGVIMRVVGVVRGIGTRNGEFDGTAPIEDLLKRTLPFVGSGS